MSARFPLKKDSAASSAVLFFFPALESFLQLMAIYGSNHDVQNNASYMMIHTCFILIMTQIWLCIITEVKQLYLILDF